MSIKHKPRIVEIGGKQWLAGMHWRTVEELPSRTELLEQTDLLSESVAATGSPPFELVAFRNDDDAIQVGFSQMVGEGRQLKRLFSLAATVADSKRQPWLGNFQISDDLWWHIAVRDSQSILMDGDVIGTWEEIQEAQESHSGFDDWNYVNGTLEDLIPLLQQVKPTKVRLADEGARWVKPAITAAIVLSLVGATFLYWHHLTYKHQQELRREAMERAKAMMQKDRPPPPPSPLLTTPMPNDLAQACGEALKNVPLFKSGWRSESFGCSVRSFTVTWKREDGATVAMAPRGTLSSDGNTVIQTLPLRLKSNKGIKNAVLLSEAKRDLFAVFQPYGVKVSLQEASVAKPLPGVKDQPAKYQPDPSAVVQFNLPFEPFGANWNAIPGFRLTRISHDTSGGDWVVTGVIYGIK